MKDCPGCVMAEECPKHGRLIPPGWTVNGDAYVCDGPGMCCWVWTTRDAWETYAEQGAMGCAASVGCA